MHFKKIMVPYDGSEPAKRAYKTAIQFAIDDPTVTVHVVRVIPAEDIPRWLDMSNPLMNSFQFQIYDSGHYNEIMQAMEEKARADIEAVVAEAEHKLGDRVVVRVVTRQDVADGIAEYVEENNCHLVVMGSRGLGGVRSILGSVSNSVLRLLEIPVLIVK